LFKVCLYTLIISVITVILVHLSIGQILFKTRYTNAFDPSCSGNKIESKILISAINTTTTTTTKLTKMKNFII